MENPEPRQLKPIRYSKSKESWRYTSGGATRSHPPYPSAIVLISWNVDRAAAYPFQRLSFLLAYIRIALDKCRVEPSGAIENAERPPPPCCLMLQKVHKEGFAAILEDRWVRDYFQVVPGSVEEWPGQTEFGNVSIISRSIPVSNARMIEFGDSLAEKHAISVDVCLNIPARPRDNGKGKAKLAEVVLRVLNTDLEGKQEGIFSRDNQLGLLAEELRDNMVDGGVLGGSMNALRLEDQSLPLKHGLADAWTRGEVDSQGFTWGYQPAKSGRRPCRLDKILYRLYRERLVVAEPRILGIGLRLSKGGFVSDHYGLLSLLQYRE